MKKNITLFVTMLMITTVFSMVPSISADPDCLIEQNICDDKITGLTPYSSVAFGQSFKLGNNADIFAIELYIEVYAPSIVGQIPIVCGISETPTSYYENWIWYETVYFEEEYHKGFICFNPINGNGNYEFQADTTYYIIIGAPNGIPSPSFNYIYGTETDAYDNGMPWNIVGGNGGPMGDENTPKDLAFKIYGTYTNNLPNTPSKPSGPNSGELYESLTFTTSATDPENDMIRYGWDWDGDTYVEEWTGYYNSGETISIDRSWGATGVYSVKVKAEDINGDSSGFSPAKTVEIKEYQPPEPNPSEWGSGQEPHATGPNSIEMMAKTATDPSGGVEYYFKCVSGGGHDSGWISSRIYTDDGLEPETEYAYQIRTRDVFGNTGSWSTSRSSTTPRENAEWTVITYLCGNSNLGFWVENCLNYIDDVSGFGTDVNVVVLFDGEVDGDSKACYIDETSQQVEIPLNEIRSSWSNEVNMGDFQTLIDFSQYCFTNFPANRYIVIPQDHGAAWRGCCRDDSGDILDMYDLNIAFFSLSDMIDRKIDIVFFNDCLMNTIDIAYQLEQYVEFQVGSETVSTTASFDDEYVDFMQELINNPDISNLDLANYISDLFNLVDDGEERMQSVSTIDLSRMQELRNSFDNLAGRLRVLVDDSDRLSEIKTVRDNCEYTEGPFSGQKERLIDLYNFVENIHNEVSDSSAQSISQNIMGLLGPSGGNNNNLITNERHTGSAAFCHGLSLYFPDESYRYNGDYTDHNEFTLDTDWDEFLSDYLASSLNQGQGWDAFIKAVFSTEHTSVTFGEDEDATDGFDSAFDEVYSNSVINDVEIYSENGIDKYSTDMRNGPLSNNIWNIVVENQGLGFKIVTLEWNIDSIPITEYSSVVLYDMESNSEIDMRTQDTYSIFINSNSDYNLEIRCENDDVPGDMNGDGSLNSGDVRYLAMHLAGNPAYAVLHADGDVNSDGGVNSADVRYLALYLAGDPVYSPLYP